MHWPFQRPPPLSECCLTQLFFCLLVLRGRAADYRGFDSRVVLIHSPSWVHCRVNTAVRQQCDFWFCPASGTGRFSHIQCQLLNLCVPTCSTGIDGYCGHSLARKDVCLRWRQWRSRTSINCQSSWLCSFAAVTPSPPSPPSFSSSELSEFDL